MLCTNTLDFPDRSMIIIISVTVSGLVFSKCHISLRTICILNIRIMTVLQRRILQCVLFMCLGLSYFNGQVFLILMFLPPFALLGWMFLPIVVVSFGGKDTSFDHVFLALWKTKDFSTSTD